MKILVLYTLNYSDIRSTIAEHLYSFKKYIKGHQFHYFNAIDEIPDYLTKINYDAVILHYTYFGQRFLDNEIAWKNFTANIKKLKGYKVAIPQDEYDKTDKLTTLFKEHNIKTVFTILNRKIDYLKAYQPKKTGIRNIFPVLTGYVDDNEVIRLKKLHKPYKDRPIDIGYRGRKLPYHFGKHGQLKYELAEFFLKKLKNTNLKCDIINTNIDDFIDNKVFIGKDWYKFLLDCKAFLGCEGGSSILDRYSQIKNKINAYLKDHPQASFEEVEQKCLTNKGNIIRCFILSPRHFEAAMTKTLQILVEGKYNGVFKPGKHYIELKKDFSNANQVLELLKNEKYCQKIIDHAYKDIVLSQKYTYSRFANMVIKHLIKQVNKTSSLSIINELKFYIFGFVIKIRNIKLNHRYHIKDII